MSQSDYHEKNPAIFYLFLVNDQLSNISVLNSPFALNSQKVNFVSYSPIVFPITLYE